MVCGESVGLRHWGIPERGPWGSVGLIKCLGGVGWVPGGVFWGFLVIGGASPSI